jgi:2,4-dienoyl-CoA reductase [(3E)-enoyl-CoA-producing], peroxisomal
MFAPNLLEGRVALVTGGGSGIGLEIAEKYARLGAKVAIVSRNRVDQAIDDLKRKGLTQAMSFVANVRNYDELQAAVAGVVRRSGTQQCGRKFLLSDGDNVLQRLAYGHRHRPQIAPFMAAGPPTNIYAIPRSEEASSRCKRYQAGQALRHAAAAKANILSLMRTLAVEWGSDDIRVNAISPGPIGDTEGARRIYQERGREDQERRRVALGRFGKKEEVANAAAYLASPLASFVTGENLIVDGGRRLKYIAE